MSLNLTKTIPESHKKTVLPDSLSFNLPSRCKIAESLNAKKLIGLDGIPLKLIKLSDSAVGKHLASIIYHYISRSYSLMEQERPSKIYL